jgi:hypothetical protein
MGTIGAGPVLANIAEGNRPGPFSAPSRGPGDLGRRPIRPTPAETPDFTTPGYQRAARQLCPENNWRYRIPKV